MNQHEEFLKAYNDYPTQDNEGFVPNRGGFKCGFGAAWDIQQKEINQLRGDRMLTEAKLQKIRDYVAKGLILDPVDLQIAKDLLGELDAKTLREKLVIAVDALEFYSIRKNYDCPCGKPETCQCGGMAREALAKLRDEK